MSDINNHSNPLHLIETITGRTVARGASMDDLCGEITEAQAGRFTIHHAEEGWFSPATMIFKEKAAAKPFDN